MCEEGYTEVLTAEGILEQCTPIPVLEIPTAGDKKADVKTSRAINPTLPTTVQPGRAGRTWYLQPFGPGKCFISISLVQFLLNIFYLIVLKVLKVL